MNIKTILLERYVESYDVLTKRKDMFSNTEYREFYLISCFSFLKKNLNDFPKLCDIRYKYVSIRKNT